MQIRLTATFNFFHIPILTLKINQQFKVEDFCNPNFNFRLCLFYRWCHSVLKVWKLNFFLKCHSYYTSTKLQENFSFLIDLHSIHTSYFNYVECLLIVLRFTMQKNSNEGKNALELARDQSLTMFYIIFHCFVLYENYQLSSGKKGGWYTV